MANRKKVIEELLQSIHAMRHKLMVGYSCKKEVAITPSQGCVLRFVAVNGSANVKAIAQALNITSSAATQLIDALVINGYLVRRSSRDDRRVSALSLSQKAHKLFKEFKEHGVQKMTELFDVLTDKELEEYAQLNKKIIGKLIHKNLNI